MSVLDRNLDINFNPITMALMEVCSAEYNIRPTLNKIEYRLLTNCKEVDYHHVMYMNVPYVMVVNTQFRMDLIIRAPRDEAGLYQTWVLTAKQMHKWDFRSIVTSDSLIVNSVRAVCNNYRIFELPEAVITDFYSIYGKTKN